MGRGGVGLNEVGGGGEWFFGVNMGELGARGGVWGGLEAEQGVGGGS